MELCKVLLFAIFGIILVDAVPSSTSPNNEDNANWRKNMQRSTRFQCSVPQPRSLSFKNFIDIRDLDSDVLPMMTVLHRCDSQSGCCTRKDEECTPIDIENVTLTFKIITILPNKKTDVKYQSVVAKNHTQCACELPHNKPK